MASTFLLEIVTPDKKFFEGQVEMLITRTSQGDIGILKGHENMVAPLSVGIIKIKRGEEFTDAACSGGFMTVSQSRVTLITDSAEWATEIDADRAFAAMERAKAMLAQPSKGLDVERAEIALKKALNRLSLTDRAV